ALQRIHSKDVSIGDAHAKNIFIDKNDKIYWLDYDGYFKKELITNKAIDILKFVYSTYTITQSYDIAIMNALNIRSELKDNEVKNRIKDLVSKNPSAFRLWLPTRISRKANNEIKKILSF
ncbi:MAG: hypothetical protein U9Q69_01755, partial [Nanoarchaeota archaeon]|nr:hypothetical protein [Nanoarchaeota archaeon]